MKRRKEEWCLEEESLKRALPGDRRAVRHAYYKEEREPAISLRRKYAVWKAMW